jgi:hypothetical protein
VRDAERFLGTIFQEVKMKKCLERAESSKLKKCLEKVNKSLEQKLARSRQATSSELSSKEKKQFEEDTKELSVQYQADKVKYDNENPQDKKRKGKGSDDESDNDDGKARAKPRSRMLLPQSMRQRKGAPRVRTPQQGAR